MPAKSLNLAGIFETAFAVCFDIRRILTLDAGIKNRQPPRTAGKAFARAGSVFLAADEVLAVPHRRIACPTVAYAAAFEAAAEGGCFLIESAVPAVCHRRQHLFDFRQFFIGNGIVASGLIRAADTDCRNQSLTFVERMDIQAAVPMHLLFIVQGVTVIIVAFRNAVAVAQKLHDGAVARCVLFQYIARFFRHSNGTDDGFWAAG